MVRLMLVLAPVMCILSGIAVSGILSTFMKNLDVLNPRKKKKTDTSYPLKNEISLFVITMMAFFLITYTFHCTWVCNPLSLSLVHIGDMSLFVVAYCGSGNVRGVFLSLHRPCC